MDNPSRRTVGAGGWGLGKDPARGPGVSSREGLCSAPNPLGRSRGDASAAQRRAIFRGGMGILAMFADFSKATGKTSYGAFTDQLKEKFERAEGLAGLKSFIQLLHSYPSPGSRPCAPSSSILRMIPRSRDMETIVEIPLAHARSHPQSKNSNDVRRSGICRFLGAKAPRPLVGWQTPNDSSAAPRLGPRPLPSRCVLEHRTTAPSDGTVAHFFFFFAAARLSSRFRSRLAGSKVAFAPPSGTGRRAQNEILA